MHGGINIGVVSRILAAHQLLAVHCERARHFVSLCLGRDAICGKRRQCLARAQRNGQTSAGTCQAGRLHRKVEKPSTRCPANQAVTPAESTRLPTAEWNGRHYGNARFAIGKDDDGRQPGVPGGNRLNLVNRIGDDLGMAAPIRVQSLQIVGVVLGGQEDDLAVRTKMR